MQYSIRPCFRSYMQMNMVTNMPISLFWDSSAFKRVAISAGVLPVEARVRNPRVASVMKSDAGTPLPLTSPMQK